MRVRVWLVNQRERELLFQWHGLQWGTNHFLTPKFLAHAERLLLNHRQQDPPSKDILSERGRR